MKRERRLGLTITLSDLLQCECVQAFIRDSCARADAMDLAILKGGPDTDLAD